MRKLSRDEEEHYEIKKKKKFSTEVYLFSFFTM